MACACASALACAPRVYRARVGVSSQPITVRFDVDTGCIPLHVMEKSPVETFFDSDIAGVRLLRRGNDPLTEFGGVGREVGAVELQQSGWSSVYTGTAQVREGEEIGFALTNVAGDVIFELGRNKRFPSESPLANEACLKNIQAGGGEYRNRVIPKVNEMRVVDGVPRFETTWAGCLPRCPLTVKLIATTGPDTGDEDNVWAIEESAAKTDFWRKYKGHFTTVSSGEFNTWGLNTLTGELAWTRNADLNQYSRGNWQSASNNPSYGGTTHGSMVDFDAGYNYIYGLTAPNHPNGGHIWRRPVSGASDWEIADGGGGRCVSATMGRTHFWCINGVRNLYSKSENGGWSHESPTPCDQLEVGDSDAFVVMVGGTSLKRKAADASGSWSSIDIPPALATAQIRQITVGDTALWLIDQTGNLWGCDLPCTGAAGFVQAGSAPANIISIDAGKVIHSLPN